MTMWSVVIILLNAVTMSKPKVISTAQGLIRGMVRDGYVAYTGLPYANISSPTERFMKAGIAPVWSHIREPKISTCTSVSNAEHCLQLDVYTPSAAGYNWPVLVWVAGGGGPYNPAKLVREGIIAVIVYHRHGPLGFLCLGNEAIPGNAGLKDVILALRWVRDNIIAFYGNPNKIVLAGQSFGAAMVDILVLSSKPSGLFHGAILQSGTALCPWAFNYDAEERAKALMDAPNEEKNDALVKKIINTESTEIVKSSNRLLVSYFPFGICSEKSLKTEEGLLFEAPYDLITTGKGQRVPMMIGYNSDEAYVFLSLLREANVIRRMKDTATILLPSELKFLNNRERKQVANQIRDLYFKKNITLESVLAYHRDAYFINHIHRSVLHYSPRGPVYYYQFSYSGEIGVQAEPAVEKAGAAHSDELGYLFRDLNLTGGDKMVEQHLLKLWSNFIKHLNPTPASEVTWAPTTPEHARLLDISTDMQMVEYPHARTASVWHNIYDKYYYSRNRVAN